MSLPMLFRCKKSRNTPNFAKIHCLIDNLGLFEYDSVSKISYENTSICRYSPTHPQFKQPYDIKPNRINLPPRASDVR